MGFLENQVREKIRSLGEEEAAEFFGVAPVRLQAWMNGSLPIPLTAAEQVFLEGPVAPVPRRKDLCVMLPWYRSASPATTFSLLTMVDHAKHGVMLQFGDAFIAHTRNKLADAFLKTDIEWAVTVDDDMVLPCGNAKWFNDFTKFDLPEEFASARAFERLLSHGKTLVGALYYGRWKDSKPMYAEGKADKDWLKRGPHDVCKPTKWVGTGCMLIHRSVFLDVEKTFPQLGRDKDGKNGQFFTSAEHDLRGGAGDVLAVLNDSSVAEPARLEKARQMMTRLVRQTEVHSSLGMGEDVAFCVRATQAGHQPHVDLGCVCGHVGSYVYGPRRLA